MPVQKMAHVDRHVPADLGPSAVLTSRPDVASLHDDHRSHSAATLWPRAMGPVRDRAGATSSRLGHCQMTFAALLGIGLGLALGQVAIPLPVAIAGAGVAALALFQATRRRRATGARPRH